jgi:hypothetical protein
MSKVPGRYAATSEQWADAIRQEERERVIKLVSSDDFYSVMAFHIYGYGSPTELQDNLTKLIRGGQA